MPTIQSPMICPTCNVAMNKVSAHEADPLFICSTCNKQQIRTIEKQHFDLPDDARFGHVQKFEFKKYAKLFPLVTVAVLFAYAKFYYLLAYHRPEDGMLVHIPTWCYGLSFVGFASLSYYYSRWRFLYSFFASAGAWTVVYLYYSIFHASDHVQQSLESIQCAILWVTGYPIVGTVLVLGHIAGKFLRMIRLSFDRNWYDIQTD